MEYDCSTWLTKFSNGYLSDTYWSSWLYVVKDYNVCLLKQDLPSFSMLNFEQDKDYTYIMNILTVGLCLFSVLAGLVQRYTHRFKYLQLSGLAIRIMQVTPYLRKGMLSILI